MDEKKKFKCGNFYRFLFFASDATKNTEEMFAPRIFDGGVCGLYVAATFSSDAERN